MIPRCERPTRTAWRLTALVAVLAVVVAATVVAEDLPQQRALLSLAVNTVDQGEVLAVVRGHDVWIEVAALTKAGLVNVEGRRETMDGRSFVSLA